MERYVGQTFRFAAQFFPRRFDMANIATVREHVSQLFANVLSLEVPSVDVDLFDAGILDSELFMALLLQLERVFGVRVEIADLDIDNFRSISCIARFVADRMSPDEIVDNVPAPVRITTRTH